MMKMDAGETSRLYARRAFWYNVVYPFDRPEADRPYLGSEAREARARERFENELGAETRELRERELRDKIVELDKSFAETNE